MKTASEALLTYLHTGRQFHICDLYEITLASGTVLRYAAYPQGITLGDGRVFSSSGPQFKRGRTKIQAGIAVDTLEVTMMVDASDTIGGSPVMTIAHNGGFDDALLMLYRCFMSAPGVVVEALEWFAGDINVNSGGGLTLELKVKSFVQRLNVDYPIRNYYPNCPYTLYDAGCGLDIDDYKLTGHVTAVTNSQTFSTDLTFASGHYDQGGVEFVSGDLAGIAAPIKASVSTAGRLTLLIPLSEAPGIGDAFTVYPGCDKKPATCLSKFNNFNRNRATPYIPLPEAIV
jgi:uncharacterized phage protein (TIGR02218 family)